jgi:hypothetical protein
MSARAAVSVLAACAVLICSACGSSAVNGSTAGSQATGRPTSSSPSFGAARITLTLSGAPSQRFSACGSDKPFLTTSGAAPITAAGSLTPFPTNGDRVKLKVKQCQAGVWQTVTEAHITISASGGYSSMVPLPGPGAYTVRAYYYPGGAAVRSNKGYVRVAT